MNSDIFVSQTIRTDPLTVYDGSNDQSTQIEKLSGYLGSFSITSNGNSLFVKFESDNRVKKNNGGFLATIHYGNTYLNIKKYLKHCILKVKIICNQR